MIAIGAGGLDVALAMGGAPFFLPCPEVVRITLKGKLGPWVSAKDVMLKMLEIFGTKGNVGRIFEYAGPGLAGLSVPERATITNMGAECGVTTSIFPSDEATRAFLALAGPRGRLDSPSPPIPTPSTRWRSRSTWPPSSPSPPRPTRRATS